MLIVFLHGLPDHLGLMLLGALAAVAALALAGAAVGRRILAPGGSPLLPLLTGALGGTALAVGLTLLLAQAQWLKGLSTPATFALIAALAVGGGFVLAGVIGRALRRP